MHQIRFQLGAHMRKTLVGPPRTSVAWTTDRPTDMLVKTAISALITLQSALCCALSALSCGTVAGSAVLQLQA